MNLNQIFPNPKPIIGMIHLPALVGYPDHPSIGAVIEKALSDLKALEQGGADGVMIENENDQPHQITVSSETKAMMTTVTAEVVKNAKHVTVGVEVLLNDPQASLSIAAATGAKFIRTDYFIDKMAREEYGGEMKIDPAGLIKYRKKLDAENVLLLTDIQVKYATLLEKGKTLATSAKQAIAAGSDGVIITGSFTGIEPDLADLHETKQAVGNFPVLIGSGLTCQNAKQLLSVADGAIVGTSIKKKSGLVSQAKVQALVKSKPKQG